MKKPLSITENLVKVENLQISSKILDVTGNPGTPGQVLKQTGGGGQMG